MKKNTYQPVIFGILCEGPCTADRELARALRQAIGESVLLPFSVEKRYVKNVIHTMRLMDIAGLVIGAEHQKAIANLAGRLHQSARATGCADVLVKRGKTFTAYDSSALACLRWCQSSGMRPRRAILLGSHPLAGSLTNMLAALGCSISKRRYSTTQPGDIAIIGAGSEKQAHGLIPSLCEQGANVGIIDLSRGLKIPRTIKRLSARQLQKDARAIRVELLTSAIQPNPLK